MKRLIITLFLPVLSFASEFWSVDEYVTLYPKQEALMVDFAKQVAGDSPKKVRHDKKVRIAILYPGGQITDYWRRSQKAFEGRMQKLGINYKIDAHFIDENNVKQLQQSLAQILQKDNDYLIFTLNIIEHKRLIAQMINNQTPKLILQNITTPLKEWADAQPFLYVGFDHRRGTKLLAQYFQKRFKTAQYLMLFHSQGYVSLMRGDSFIEFTKDDFKMQKAYYTYIDKEKAYQRVKEYPKLDELDFIYSCSTDIAVGASQALQEAGKKSQVLLNGWGGGSLELEMIQKGLLDVTVMRINDDNGVAMADAIARDLQDKAVPTIFSGELVIVDSNTDTKEIQKLKKRAFRYSDE
ncbi:MAG: substrate-binding domain-containing protein [Campylobacterota bacterium]